MFFVEVLTSADGEDAGDGKKDQDCQEKSPLACDQRVFTLTEEDRLHLSDQEPALCKEHQTEDLPWNEIQIEIF